MIRQAIFTFLLSLSGILGFAQSWHPVSDDVLCCGGESVGAYWGGLFASGGFTQTQRIAFWDGQKWDSIGFGQNGPIKCYAEYQGKMYFGGDFSRVGEWSEYPHTMSIVAWDGLNWFPVLTEYFGGRINAMQTYNGELYATGEGNFFEINGVSTSKIAKWNGTQWSAVGNSSGLGPGNNRGLCMAIYDNKLIVGGIFGSAGGIETYCIASWDGSEWDTIGEYGLGGYLTSLAVDTVNNYLYAGGAFLVPGSVKSKNIARWDGVKWDSLGLGTLMDVSSLEMYNGKLYVGVYAQTGEPTDTILMVWDGQQWEYLIGFDGNIYDMEVYRNCLFVAGVFDQVPDSVQAKYIACYGEDCSEALGVNELTASTKTFIIYPNPNSGVFTIKTDEILQDDVEIVITDIAGKTVFTGTIKKHEQLKEIRLPNGAKGIYSCSLFKGKELVQTERIVLE